MKMLTKKKRGRPKKNKTVNKVVKIKVRKAKKLINEKLQKQKLMLLGGMPPCSLCGDLIYVPVPYKGGADFRQEDGNPHGMGYCLSEQAWKQKCVEFMEKWKQDYQIINREEGTTKKVRIKHKAKEVKIRKLDKKLWEAEYDDIKITATTKGELLKRIKSN